MKQQHLGMLLALGASLAFVFFGAAPAVAHTEVTAPFGASPISSLTMNW